jgi:hypothetical protein
MTDPGLVAALGIEAVEWLDEAGDRVTVRISGRWRRRPTATGQPWLVVESHGKRHRFPAMPEPPGLTGTLPGTWRMTFRVPADLTHAPDVRAWLQLGVVLVPLPAEPPPAEPVVEPIPPALEPSAVGVSELEEAAHAEQLREVERVIEAERARTAAAESAASELAFRVAELGNELDQREADVAQLGVAIAEHEGALRVARQHAHAEEMVRLELTRERDRLKDMLQASRLRVRGLEDDLVVLRRRADEAEHLAAAARRPDPPTPVASPPAPPPQPAPANAVNRSEIYAAERALVRLAGSASPPRPLRPLPARPEWTERERMFAAARSQRAARTLALVERERDARIAAEVVSERERDARIAAEAVSERLRCQLEEQEARSARAFAALDELREQIAWVRQAYLELSSAATAAPEAPPAAADPTPASNGGLELHRLDAARTRLREQTPALPDEEAAQAEAAASSLPLAAESTRAPFTLARFAGRDPERAGTLLIELLPAQGLVHERALAYDLILDPSTCVRVTVADGGATSLIWMHTARAPEDVRFAVEGDPASIIRLLTAGPVRRLFLRRRLAQVRGDATGLDALRDLLYARLPVAELERVGVRVARLEVDAEPPNRATSD